MKTFLVYPRTPELVDLNSTKVQTIDTKDTTALGTYIVAGANMATDCFVKIEHTGIRQVDSTNSTYIYALPCYPDNINESQGAQWSQSAPLGRSSPLSAYVGTGYRSMSFPMRLHREMCNGDEAYIDNLLATLRKSVFPLYIEQGLTPPVTTFQFGEYRCKGYVESVGYNWQKPIIDGHYQLCDVNISFIDVPEEAFSANNLSSMPTNPFNVKPLISR
jgi:hypothetical protein